MIYTYSSPDLTRLPVLNQSKSSASLANANETSIERERSIERSFSSPELRSRSSSRLGFYTDPSHLTKKTHLMSRFDEHDHRGNISRSSSRLSFNSELHTASTDDLLAFPAADREHLSFMGQVKLDSVLVLIS